MDRERSRRLKIALVFGPVRYDPSEEDEFLYRYFSAHIVLGSYISISFAARFS